MGALTSRRSGFKGFAEHYSSMEVTMIPAGDNFGHPDFLAAIMAAYLRMGALDPDDRDTCRYLFWRRAACGPWPRAKTRKFGRNEITSCTLDRGWRDTLLSDDHGSGTMIPRWYTSWEICGPQMTTKTGGWTILAPDPRGAERELPMDSFQRARDWSNYFHFCTQFEWS